jgi:hypothetical protein
MNDILNTIIKILLLIIIIILIIYYFRSLNKKENFKCNLDNLDIDDLVIINRNPEYVKLIDKLIIVNTYGQTFTLNAQSPNVFDLRFLNAGIYFIEGIQENKKTQTFKLIKQ